MSLAARLNGLGAETGKWAGNVPGMPQSAPGVIISVNNNKIIILAIVAVGHSVLACRACTYQGFLIDLVSFVPPFGKIVAPS